ncbi:MAG: NAD(+)/NADH kinase [Pyrodictiaceae archaeon]
MELGEFIGIFARPDTPESLRIVKEAYEILNSMNIDVRIDISLKPFLPRSPSYRYFDIRFEVPRKTIVVGGDGTLLRLYSIIGERGSTIVHPIKAGRRGFLFELDEFTGLQRLKDFVEDKYRIEELMRIRVLVFRREPSNIEHCCVALNEAALFAPGSKTLVLRVRADNEVLYDSLEGDGVIVSTPVGSTAYSLSAGGPLLDYELEAYVVTPVNPVSYARPYVISARRRIIVQLVRSRRTPLLIIDGQECDRLRNLDGFIAEKSSSPARIARYGKPRRLLQI